MLYAKIKVGFNFGYFLLRPESESENSSFPQESESVLYPNESQELNPNETMNSAAFQLSSEKDKIRIEIYAMELREHENTDELPFMFTQYLTEEDRNQLLIGTLKMPVKHLEFDQHCNAKQEIFVPIKEHKNECYLPFELKSTFVKTVPEKSHNKILGGVVSGAVEITYQKITVPLLSNIFMEVVNLTTNEMFLKKVGEKSMLAH